MAVVLVKREVRLIQQKAFIYGIIPLVVLFLFFSIHTAFTLAGATTQSGQNNVTSEGISIITSSFSGSITVTGNEDVSGQVTVPAGSNGIEVVFAQAFTSTPSIVLEMTDSEDIDRYFIEDVTPQGFTLLIDPIQTTDVTFIYRAKDNTGTSFKITDNFLGDFSIIIEDKRVEALKVATGK